MSKPTPRLVLIESPWQGNVRKHRNYARRALRHSLSLGEAPIASHLLYTQPGVLKDELPKERAQGIAAGLAWGQVADAAIFYADYGFSMGMLHALKRHSEAGVPVEIRYLFKRAGKGALASPKRARATKRKGAPNGAPITAMPDLGPIIDHRPG